MEFQRKFKGKGIHGNSKEFKGNSKEFMEISKGLARRVIENKSSDKERVIYGFQLCLHIPNEFGSPPLILPLQSIAEWIALSTLC